jgi:hypothetical protein
MTVSFCRPLVKMLYCASYLRAPLNAARAPRPILYHTGFRLFSAYVASYSAAAGSSILPHPYIPIEDVEMLERYRPGGYHPVRIGDHLHNRYEVVQKLGYGSYSTIWLARDKTLGRVVAVKVCTAEANPHELNIFTRLSTSRQNPAVDPGKDLIPSILNTFTVNGPNGSYLCYVSTPAKMSIADGKDASYHRLFTLEVARALSAQLALAVCYLHSHGSVHGDIHDGNVLLQLPSVLIMTMLPSHS